MSTPAERATSVHAVASGRSRPPWKRTAFWLTASRTGQSAASAPATTPSACSRLTTLKAKRARRPDRAATTSPVAGTSGMGGPSFSGEVEASEVHLGGQGEGDVEVDGAGHRLEDRAAGQADRLPQRCRPVEPPGR